VSSLDFRTSCGYLEGGGARAAAGCPGRGPSAVITDFGVLRPHPETDELQLTAVYPGVTVEAVRQATGWPLKTVAHVEVLDAPDPADLARLRDLHERTRAAHANRVKITLK
jgi:glutaconate CoA-transferase subunit B